MGRCAGNATRAYMEAYDEDNLNQAASSASDLLRVPKVRAAIEERISNDPLVADRHELQRRLSAIARGEDRGATEYDAEGNRVERWGSKVSDEIAAAKLLMQTRGQLIEKHEHSGPDGKPVEVKHTADMTTEELIAKAGRLHRERAGKADGE